MNNQITIINNLNQEESVELISYFQNINNKKYLFYTKNEMVQDGLIKIYVAEESTGVPTEITDEEWNNIKFIMQDILKNNGASITYLATQDKVTVGTSKVIAFNNQNLEGIKKAYNESQTNVVSNADMLVQSFGTSTADQNLTANVENTPVLPSMDAPLKEEQVITPTTEVVPTTPTVEPSLNISGIPGVANFQDLEKNPVNLNMSSTPLVESDATNSTNVNIENTIPSNEGLVVPSINDLNIVPLPTIEKSITEEENIEPMKEETKVAESPFQMSSAPNIFDQPSAFAGIVPTPVEEPKEETSTVKEMKNDMVTEDVSGEINIALIEIEKENAKLFEQLASNCRKKVELLQNQQKLNPQKTFTNDSAASLFDNEGALIENNIDDSVKTLNLGI